MAAINKRYRMDTLIGVGGMGKVFQGLDTRTNTPVAIKQLKPDILLTDPDLMTRFRREGEMLRQLNHPNIVKLLDTVAEGDENYIIMEFVTGGSLETLLQTGSMPISRIIQIALDLADALTRAHRLDIIHRDLKPANVLMSADGTPRLTDFGVAHIEAPDRLTQTGTAMGTLDYLSPEALNGEAVDSRADIWSFGVMLFEMVAGQRPFRGETIYQLMQSIVRDPLPDLEQLRPDCPITLVDLIYRMVTKDRDARIRSVRQVGVELESILRGDTVKLNGSGGRFGSAPLDISPAEAQHNLPAQQTPFVGRESEITELYRMLHTPGTRLITILGPGGIGKTRLALEIASREIHNYANGVFFIDLAPLSTPLNIVTAVADAVSYQFQMNNRPPEQQLLDFLANKHMLLIMDNYEHLLAGARFVADILRAAPKIQIFVTSRQRLNQTGETVYNLEGMDFPAWETPDDALEYAAVKLFMQSARRVRPDFELRLDNMDYVARICKLVQGMPLGILLAASWLGMLTPDEIAGEIERNFDFLSNDISDLPERQRSIRGVFEYSWNLMTEAEQNVFIALSVFRGGFSREAATAIAGASLPVLMALMNKSLIRRDVDSGRYDVHELLRQYAAERLEASGKEAGVRDRHMAHYADFVAKLLPDIKGRRLQPALEEMDADFENIRLAWERVVEQVDTIRMEQMDDTMMLYFIIRSRGFDGSRMFPLATEALKDKPQHRRMWGRMTSRALRFTQNLGAIHDQVQLAEESLAIAEEFQNPHDEMIARWMLARQHIGAGHYDRSVEVLEDAVKNAEKLGDRNYLAAIMFQISAGYMFDSKIDLAIEYLEKSLNISRSIGALNIEGQVLGNLGSFYLHRDNLPEAERLYQESYDINIRMGNRWSTGFALAELGVVSFLKGNLDNLRRYIQRTGEITANIPEIQLIGLESDLTGFEAAMREDYATTRAACEPHINHFNLYVQLFARFGMTLAYCGTGDFSAAREMNLSLIKIMQRVEDHAATAYLLAFEAVILAHEGQPERALELLALAYTYPKTVNGWLNHWPLLTRLREKLDKEAGRDGDDAWERGKSLDLNTVLASLVPV